MTETLTEEQVRSIVEAAVEASVRPLRDSEALITRQTRITVGLAWGMTAAIVAGLVGFYTTISGLDSRYVTREVFELHMKSQKDYVSYEINGLKAWIENRLDQEKE